MVEKAIGKATEEEVSALRGLLVSLCRKKPLPLAEWEKTSAAVQVTLVTERALEIYAAVVAAVTLTPDSAFCTKAAAKWIPIVGDYWNSSR